MSCLLYATVSRRNPLQNILPHCGIFDHDGCSRTKHRIAAMPFNHFYSVRYDIDPVIVTPRDLDIATQNDSAETGSNQCADV
jgi:hypothetical protein